MKLWLDCETYSETPINCGTYRYAEDSEIMLITYAIDDEEPELLDLTCTLSVESIMAEVNSLVRKSDEVWAQNSMFDRSVFRYNGLDVPIHKWRDTLIQAYAHGLPGKLDALCRVLGLPEDLTKIKEGRDLIQLFCKPRPKNHKLRRATRGTHPEEWHRFCEYAKRDIVAMRECHKRMPKATYPNGPELKRWHMDQRINDLGFCVDMELVDAAIKTAKMEQQRLKGVTCDMTDGELGSTSQVAATLEYLLESHGVSLQDLSKATVNNALSSDIPEAVKELLRIRLQVGSSSASKYKALAKAANSDSRCRGTIQHLGAKRTGRAAGRTFQPQNLPSRGLLEDAAISFGIDAIKEGQAPFLYPNVMKLLVSCVRGCLVAAPGHKLVVADLSNIEGRKAAWVAGEDWKLQAFRDFDAGIGQDLYILAYANSFKVGVDTVSKDQRQIGKVMELMLAYQGRVGAFLTGAATYGFDIDQLAHDVWDTLPEGQVKESNSFHAFAVKKGLPLYGLSKKSFVTCDVLARMWRQANSAISSYWPDLEGAARSAIGNPGNAIPCRRVAFLFKGGYLWLKLPSGRMLAYPGARVEEDGKITFLGEHPYTRKWTRLSIYGGMFLENICQASSRDILYDAMEPAWNVGYRAVIHVHDELVTETIDTNTFTVDVLCSIMTSSSPWAEGLPLAAAGFEGYRYRK